MEREPQGEMYMQRKVFLARLFVQAKCGRAARMHRQRRKEKGERMREGQADRGTDTQARHGFRLHVCNHLKTLFATFYTLIQYIQNQVCLMGLYPRKITS